ncbi:MAG: alpha/beta hydrolase [Proteobacteria bacterium]|nr:alpha/beta hydrolase [Pseudomonadota bacterium]
MRPTVFSPQFDPDQSEAEYNLRRRHADFPEILARWQAWSAQTRATLALHADQAYGPSEDERVDIFPAAQAGAPLLLFIHGGYWQGGDKRDVSFVAHRLVGSGIAVAVSNYALAPHVPLGTMVEQTRRLVDWLHREAARFGADPQRIFLMGHSAGGHLAAMMLSDHGPQQAGVRAALRGVFAISGLFELTPLLTTSINRALGLSPEQAVQLSPARGRRVCDAPLWTLVGADETESFRTQAGWIAAQWSNVRPLPWVAGKHHYTVLDIFRDAAHPCRDAIAGVVLGC